MGDYKGARTYHEQSLAMKWQVHGEEAVHADIAVSLHALGGVCYQEGDLAAAKLHWEEALAIWSTTLPLTHPHIKDAEGELQMVEQQIEQQKHDPRFQQQQKLRAKVASRQAKQAKQESGASDNVGGAAVAGASDAEQQAAADRMMAELLGEEETAGGAAAGGGAEKKGKKGKKKKKKKGK
jgi:hypothetical protein